MARALEPFDLPVAPAHPAGAGLSGFAGVPAATGLRSADFLRSCQSTCEAGGTAPGLCTTYCQSGLEGVETNDLWNAIETGMVTAGEQALLDAQNRQCSAVIYPELNAPQ